MQPLAEILRPNNLSEFIGQEKLIGPDSIITKLIESDNIPSMIFWGPPASGKTSLARLIANHTKAEFLQLSAVMEGKEDFKKIIRQAEQNISYGRKTILFIDEIHRWNKAQQDALLPFVENGTITLIGATTENPSFSIISALLSRCRVFVFEPHTQANILEALSRATKVLNLKIESKYLEQIASLSDGDMRFALNTLEIAAKLKHEAIDEQTIEAAAQKSILYDKNGEEHYNLISAVHKSLRSSNATAGVYWVVRMLVGGEDPLYIARRLVRFASEDIGNANPNALLLANQVYIACQNLGMPECETALVQLAEFLANSPKNNAAYTALNSAKADIAKYGALPVPLHFRNAPTKLMKNLGYGKGYQYDHDLENKKSDQQAMPDELMDRNYFKKGKS
jgi:putative ATPase